MRFVHEAEPGVIELRWTWLPTWIGQNTILKSEIEQHIMQWLADQEGPIEINDENLDLVHEEVLEFLRVKFPEPTGLMRYLEAVKHVEEEVSGQG